MKCKFINTSHERGHRCDLSRWHSDQGVAIGLMFYKNSKTACHFSSTILGYYHRPSAYLQGHSRHQFFQTTNGIFGECLQFVDNHKMLSENIEAAVFNK